MVLGGQAGVAGHLKIGALSRIGAQAGVPQDVDEGANLMGTPTIPTLGWYRSASAFEKLPEMAKELRALRKRVEELEMKGETK